MRSIIILFALIHFVILPDDCNDKYNNNATGMISDVQVRSSWIDVYDENGKKVSSMPASNKQVAGVASDFFVVLSGGWIDTYDIKCKKIASMPASGKIVKGASGKTFTVKAGSWIDTYDRNCKKIRSRPER